MASQTGWLERASRKATEWTGSSAAFALAFGIVIVWAITGPYFEYSNTWQLVINTGTTIVTFLMVFLIQRSQNKDSLAIHLKLNELVAAIHGASNRLISAEELSEDEVQILRNHFRKLVELAKQDEEITCSHSIEDAEADHVLKKAARVAEKARLTKGTRRKSKGKRAPKAEPKPAPKPANGEFQVGFKITSESELQRRDPP